MAKRSKTSVRKRSPQGKSAQSKTASRKPSKASSKAGAKRKGTARRWVSEVDTDSTFPPEGTFKKDAASIAKTMASKKVSPKGIGSGVRMVQYFINRGGKKLPPDQKRELEKAKKLLQAKKRKQEA